MIILRKKASPTTTPSLIPNVNFNFVGITVNAGSQANVTNGSGLNPATPALTGIHELYTASNGVQSANHGSVFPRTLLFTLPSVYWVSGMSFWQVTGASININNGINAITLQYSLDNVSWLTIPNSPSNLPIGGNSPSNPLPYSWNPVQARFIRFVVTSVWGGTRIALSEVQFSGYL